MAATARLQVEDRDPLGTLQVLFMRVLEQKNISGLLIPQKLPHGNMPMPTFVTTPEELEGVDPLAPAFSLNAARLVARLTRKPLGGTIVAVMRPCEVRAFVELVKLKQGSHEGIILMSIDCLGAFQNRTYRQVIEKNDPQICRDWILHASIGKGTALGEAEISDACRACEFPISENADIVIGFLGINIEKELLLLAQTPKGEALLPLLEYPETEVPEQRQEAIDTLMGDRLAFRDAMFEKTKTQINAVEKMAGYFSNCVNCYNCRVACPVCYCRECVFLTDAFDYDPAQYLKMSQRKGLLKMPTDTLFYHLTRLAHMSTACVGCGQCSNACPNDIPVMQVFRLVSQRVQEAFSYQAGRSPEDMPPLSEFQVEEFEDVVGLD